MQFPKALLLLCVAVGPSLAWAQPDSLTPTPTATVPNEERHFLRLYNVRASAMVWWLDPANNPLPVVFLMNPNREASYAGAIPRSQFKGRLETPVAKPRYQKGLERFPGVEYIFGIDAQNVLMVVGSADGLAKVQAEVAKMDVPPQEVSVQQVFLRNGWYDNWRTGK